MATGAWAPRLSEEKRAQFVGALTKGGTIRIAAGVARIPLRTAEDWLRKGREQLNVWADMLADQDEAAEAPPLTVYAAFWLDCAEAIAKRDLDWLGSLQTADKKTDDWGRYAWLLERTAPADFGLRDVRRPELGGGGGVTVSEGVALSAVSLILEAAGKGTGHPVLAGRENRKDPPRPALPAARPVLAEPAAGEPAADSVPAP